MKYERIKFLVIALRESVEIYAWAPKPYHKFMAFKTFSGLQHKPLLVDMTIEEGVRLKVIYGSSEGFHAIDLDSGNVYDIYIPCNVSLVSLLPLHTFRLHQMDARVPHAYVLPKDNNPVSFCFS